MVSFRKINWPKDIKEAKEVQLVLREDVRILPLRKKIKYVAGVDAAFFKDNVIATACLYTYPHLIHVGDAYAVTKVLFPYIPGYLSFREGPAIIEAINKLSIKPDIILFDGQGIAHPKGLGIASHIGVLLGMPTIGCAKSRLVGDYADPGIKKGEYSHLKYHGKTIGAVLRTRDNVKPVFVSPGNLIDLQGAIDVVLKCTGRYRIPEPIRCADSLAGKIKSGLC
ncbi:MAG: deoxyribonuclease V [Nitrospirota bacterium]|nr:deoxyribonuclease V [Nitrospirota bacterium]